MVRDIKMYRTTSEMRSPRPSYGRVGGIYDPQGSTRYGRLGPLTGGLSRQNSCTNLNRYPDRVIRMYTLMDVLNILSER